MTYRIGPDLIEIPIEIPDESHGPYCEVCGGELEWDDCDTCGGEGEFDWETLQFDDPLWYQPGDVERCSQCEGKGGWWYCWNTDAPAHTAQRLEEEKEDRGE